MDIEREEEWNDSIETIRARHGIPVYRSGLPANLMESLDAGRDRRFPPASPRLRIC